MSVVAFRIRGVSFCVDCASHFTVDCCYQLIVEWFHFDSNIQPAATREEDAAVVTPVESDAPYCFATDEAVDGVAASKLMAASCFSVARSRLMVALDADKVSLLSLRYRTALCEGDLLVESFHHGDDDDIVGCVGSPVVDGLHQQHANKNKNKYLSAKKRWCQRAISKIDIFGLAIAKIDIFGLVRVIKFQLDSRYSLFLVVQVYSKFFASAIGIAFIIICSWKSIDSLWEYTHHRFTRECENTYLYFKCQKTSKSTYKFICGFKTLNRIFS